MPTYVYKCPTCGHTTEMLRKMSEHKRSKPVCPYHPQTTMETVLQPVATVWPDGPPTPRDLARRLNRGIPDHVQEGSLEEHRDMGYKVQGGDKD